jgi:hypothetical protein
MLDRHCKKVLDVDSGTCLSGATVAVLLSLLHLILFAVPKRALADRPWPASAPMRG